MVWNAKCETLRCEESFVVLVEECGEVLKLEESLVVRIAECEILRYEMSFVVWITKYEIF